MDRLEISRQLLDHLKQLARDVAHGLKADPRPLFELTKKEIYPEAIVELAESFGMMVVKVETREFRLRQLVEDLQETARQLREAHDALRRQNRNLRQNLRRRYTPYQLVGVSAGMQKVIQTIERVADTPVNVLLLGETGTGKEVVAKTLHFNSSRAEKPFVSINCAALPESLLESELFGIEKGVATGVAARIGVIEQAHQGTLFLDEIGDMPAASQAALLRVLEEREVRRLGGRHHIAVDVRVIAATHRDLKEEVMVGRFREDLYYRLNVVTIRIPPLRERHQDLPILARYLLKESCQRLGRGRMELSPESLACMEAYPWPGNIRELRNEMERCAALCPDTIIGAEDLSEDVRRACVREENHLPDPIPVTAKEMTLEEMEKEAIRMALERAGGNKSKAARLLGISREGLRRKLQRHGFA